MGIQDLEKLFEIKGWISEFNKTFGVQLSFIIDSDTKTAVRILINQKGEYQIKKTLTQDEANELRSQGFDMFVPDLMDAKHKLVIEYQEEPKPQRGPKIVKKGHDEFSDLGKDDAYSRAGFKQHKIWESDSLHDQKLSLFEFLFTVIKGKLK